MAAESSPWRLSPVRCAMIAFYAAVVSAAFAGLPMIALSDSGNPSCSETLTLDARMAIKGKYFGSILAEPAGVWPSDEELLPFDTIVIERVPCYGACPDYRMTLRRDGRAELVDRTTGHTGRFLGRIDIATFARLSQLGRRAQRTATRSEYQAAWTDDSTDIVTLSGREGSWRVLDYGEIAPVEVWALASLLHVQYERIVWNAR